MKKVRLGGCILIGALIAICIALISTAFSGCTESQNYLPHTHECKPDEPARQEIFKNREQIIENYKQIEKNRKQLKGFKRSNYDKRFTALVWPVPFPTPLPEPRQPKPVPTFKIFLC